MCEDSMISLGSRPMSAQFQGRSYIGEYGGMAVMAAGDECSEPHPLGGLGQGGQRRPTLEARPGGVGENRIEVVERPAGFVDVDVVGCLPDGQHVGPGGVLRGCLESESHCVEP